MRFYFHFLYWLDKVFRVCILVIMLQRVHFRYLKCSILLLCRLLLSRGFFYPAFSRLFFSEILAQKGMDNGKCAHTTFVWSVDLKQFSEKHVQERGNSLTDQTSEILGQYSNKFRNCSVKSIKPLGITFF